MTAPSQVGRYRLLGVLGKAALGTLYHGHDDVIGREVVIKVLTHDGSDPQVRNRFQREAMITARLTHPNIISVLDVGSDEDTLYMSFEALQGQSLRQALDAGISLSVSIPIIVQVLNGLAYVHANGVVHRDIKPDNIFIRTDGVAKIMNFELARVISTSPMTGTGNIVGTPDDMSPEQVMGSRVDARSDLFSVGCTLYECVTGRGPFHSETLVETFYRIVQEELDMGSIPQETPWTGLRRVIASALQKRPEDRYPDAQAMSTDLRSALKDLGERASWMARTDPTIEHQAITSLTKVSPGG